MKIIKNNNKNEIKETKSKFPMKVICEHCGSEIELEENDVEIGALGLYNFICPCCGELSDVDDGIELTSDNLQFPKHYYHFGNGVRITDDRIDKYVKDCINVLRNSTDKNFYHTSISGGDTIIHVTRYDGDENFAINVCKNYYETNIPYTEEDKEKWCE